MRRKNPTRQDLVSPFTWYNFTFGRRNILPLWTWMNFHSVWACLFCSRCLYGAFWTSILIIIGTFACTPSQWRSSTAFRACVDHEHPHVHNIGIILQCDFANFQLSHYLAITPGGLARIGWSWAKLFAVKIATLIWLNAPHPSELDLFASLLQGTHTMK